MGTCSSDNGRNYFELCNEALDIMFYSPAETFDDLDTTEGRLVKRLMNSNLREICYGEKGIWKFREDSRNFYTVAGQSKYSLPDGYILFIRPNDNSNRIPLTYNEEWQFLPMTATGTPVQYWIYENKINLFPTPSKSTDGVLHTIRYLKNNLAKDSNGNEKLYMSEEGDTPIIPEEYRSLLVYGTCRDFRRKRGDAKASYFKDEYNELYMSMLDNQRLTDDYIAGGKVGGYPMSTLQA